MLDQSREPTAIWYGFLHEINHQRLRVNVRALRVAGSELLYARGECDGYVQSGTVDPPIDGRWSMINLHWHGRTLISAAAVQSKPP